MDYIQLTAAHEAKTIGHKNKYLRERFGQK